MIEELQQHMENALEKFTEGDFYEILLEARREYFKKTGPVNEDDDDYESRISAFNDWYLLHFIAEKTTKTVIKEYILSNDVDEAIKNALLYSVNYSLFEFLGINFSGRMVFKDLLHRKKIILPKGHPRPGMLKKDLFLGRVLNVESDNYLLAGITILPRDAKHSLIKQCKKVYQLRDKSIELDFLLEVERLKEKSKHFEHVGIDRIFQYKQLRSI